MSSGARERWDLLRRRLAEARQVPLAKREAGCREAPLSEMQERIHILHRRDAASCAYHDCNAYRLRGDLDEAAFELALRAVIERHEILRTVFPSVAYRAHQLVLDSSDAAIARDDLSALPSAEREAALQALATQEAQAPFEIERRPPLRVRIVRLGARERALLLTVHHIIWDQGSLSIFWGELATLYAAHRAGREHRLEPLEHQYADYATWQRTSADAAARASASAGWRRRLLGAPQESRLPGDPPSVLGKLRKPSGRREGRTHWFDLGAPAVAALAELESRCGSTRFDVLLGLLAVLLGRLRGQTDLVIGSAFSQRQRPELRKMIGPLIRTLPLRIDISGDPTVFDFFARVDAVVLEALRDQDAAVDAFDDRAASAGALGDGARMDVALAYYREPTSGARAHGLDLELIEIEIGRARYDLELYFWEVDDHLRGSLVYRADLYAPSTIAAFLQSLAALLQSAAEAPTQRLAELSLLTAAQRAHLLVACNATARALPDQGVQELFAEWAGRAPAAPALEFGAQRYSYGESRALVALLAARLRALELEPGALVGIWAVSSAAWVIAECAILEAGCAYVPLDAQAPWSLAQDVLRVLPIRALVACVPLPDQARSLELPVLVPTESAAGVPCPSSGEVGARRAFGDDLAYVMPTSGSTGRRKAVMVPHRAIRRLVVRNRFLEILPSDRVCQASHPAFDAATFEVWGALANGACLVGIPRSARLVPRELESFLAEQRISVLFLTTALFHAVARERPSAFAGLRVLLFGGEASDARLVRRVLDAGPPGRVLHVYGPTENTTFSTYHEVRCVDEDALSIPIGKPIDDTATFVLDAFGSPVPPGLRGELCLGGAGLAIGYWGDHERNARAFFESRLPEARGQRLYRTGDLVRQAEDGTLWFEGRTDDQLKLRGFRVEPAEIEEALRQHPRVEDARVVVREAQLRPQRADEEAPSERELVALVVPSQELPPGLDELRAHLRERLPGYMIPSVFVPLESLPLSSTGKIDRQLVVAELEPWIEHRRLRSASCIAPRTALERTLEQLWRETLWIDEAIGIDEDFFALGGHSLLAVRLVSRIESTLGLELPIAALFQLSTIAELAAHLEGEAQPRPSDAPPERSFALRAPEGAGLATHLAIFDHSLPYYDKDSGSVRLFEIVKILRGLGVPLLFVPSEDVAPEPYASALEALGVELICSRFAPGAQRHSQEQQLRERLPTLRAAWICKPATHDRWASLLAERPSIAILYDTVDLHFLRAQRESSFRRGGSATPPSPHLKLVEQHEVEICARADVAIAISAKEGEMLRDRGVSRVAVVPDIHRSRGGVVPPSASRSGILFIGGYKHTPNVDAVVWLCEAIMPRVWQSLPEVHLTLLGSSPGALVRRLANERVTVTGYVPDVEPFFRSHRVFVAPLLYGAGMKGKIGQSLEHALPIVSTSVGIEGMGLEPERDVLVADSASAFAEQILRLYAEPELWERLSARAPACIAPFAPDRVRELLRAILDPFFSLGSRST
ncbi:MAG: amino acid adenylation domain-containing protein [Planctomycetes bacterium]|nr:amino acid adenylation domain-containing protein [Planctomycetota bacterium]